MRIARDPWICAEGPDADVVVSCRARVARNLEGFSFSNRADPDERREIVNIARQVLLALPVAPQMLWVDLVQAPERDRRLLVERHLISAALASADHDRAVAISDDERLSVMVNEEDHLRIQVLGPGLRLDEVHRRVNEVDDAIEARLDFAFDSRWGYLTACPTNVGTGIRVSAMLHLPALAITKEINRVRRAAKDLHLAVRGYYGEGSESAGDFYQVSNQVTLGTSEEEILAEFASAIVPRIVEYERRARRALAERNPTLLDDKVHRALGILRAARLLRRDEAMRLLSRVRLGVHLGRLEEVDARTIGRLFIQVEPAHLQLGAEEPLADDAIDARRAEVVRRALS